MASPPANPPVPVPKPVRGPSRAEYDKAEAIRAAKQKKAEDSIPAGGGNKRGGVVKKKYADGGNVASGSPGYGFNQMNAPMMPQPPMVPQSMGATPFAGSSGAPMAPQPTFRKGGKAKKYSKGGSVKSSASRRGDGIASRGKTKGRMV